MLVDASKTRGGCKRRSYDDSSITSCLARRTATNLSPQPHLSRCSSKKQTPRQPESQSAPECPHIGVPVLDSPATKRRDTRVLLALPVALPDLRRPFRPGRLASGSNPSRPTAGLRRHRHNMAGSQLALLHQLRTSQILHHMHIKYRHLFHQPRTLPAEPANNRQPSTPRVVQCLPGIAWTISVRDWKRCISLTILRNVHTTTRITGAQVVRPQLTTVAHILHRILRRSFHLRQRQRQYLKLHRVRQLRIEMPASMFGYSRPRNV